MIWTRTGPDRASGEQTFTLPVPAGCSRATVTVPLPPTGQGSQRVGLAPSGHTATLGMGATGQVGFSAKSAVTEAPVGMAPFFIGGAAALAIAGVVGGAAVLRRRRLAPDLDPEADSEPAADDYAEYSSD